MTNHIEKGKEGELLASRYLSKKEFEILYCNWRYRHYEIDIIALKDNVIHFVEVKTRKNTTYGYPEESVTVKKFRNLKNGAVAFLARFREVKKIQFDILSILTCPGKTTEYFFIEDVYLD